jgi:hypothetical protein
MDDETISGTEPDTVPAGGELIGIPASGLATGDLLRELASVHRTRHATLRNGSEQALAHHDARMAELEQEYLRRFPGREVDPERLSAGVRARRTADRRTGAEQTWDPEDFAVAAGRDPTPENIEWARAEMARDGAAAIERLVP